MQLLQAAELREVSGTEPHAVEAAAVSTREIPSTSSLPFAVGIVATHAARSFPSASGRDLAVTADGDARRCRAPLIAEPLDTCGELRESRDGGPRGYESGSNQG